MSRRGSLLTFLLKSFIACIFLLSFQREAMIDIAIIDDEEVETAETFTVTLLRVIGGARLGEVTSVTVSIPPNDSPLGRFGFLEQEVSLN